MPLEVLNTASEPQFKPRVSPSANNLPESNVQATQSSKDRETLIVSHLPLVKFLAGVLSRQLPRSVEKDDLISAGYIGLIEAADRFDANAGVSFSAFARLRIRGAMLDFLREQDPVGRIERSKLDLSGEAGPVHIPVSSDEHFELIAPVVDIDNQIDVQCRLGLVRNALQQLTSARQEILASLFDAELSAREIAARLGITVERVWHLRHTALIKLRKMLVQSKN